MAAAAEAALEIALEAALVVAVRFGKKKGPQFARRALWLIVHDCLINV